MSDSCFWEQLGDSYWELTFTSENCLNLLSPLEELFLALGDFLTEFSTSYDSFKFFFVYLFLKMLFEVCDLTVF